MKKYNHYKNRFGLRIPAILSIYQIIIGTIVSIGLVNFIKDFTAPDVISPISDNPYINVVYADSTRSSDNKAIIQLYFGEHTGKALKLLECENRSLSSTARNDNKDGSRDLGLFQINTYWHGFNMTVNNERYLYDPYINAAIAWRIYEGSNYSFRLWTCGKTLGI